MKLNFTAIIILFLSLTQLNAQDTYKGKFSKNEKFLGSDKFIPIGTHKAYDQDESLSYKVKYGANGIIRKISIKKNEEQQKASFSESFDKIEWVKIKDGVWINKVEGRDSTFTEFDTEQDVKLHYSGNLLNGAPFDTSFIRNKPLTGKLGYFIKGFSLGVTNMNKGEVRAIKIAPEMGYGNERSGIIPPSSTLIYYIYLIE